MPSTTTPPAETPDPVSDPITEPPQQPTEATDPAAPTPPTEDAEADAAAEAQAHSQMQHQQATPPAQAPAAQSQSTTSAQTTTNAQTQTSATTPAGATTVATAADVRAGAQVHDTTGGLVGTVESVDARGAVVSTGTARATIPVASFGRNNQGLVISMTKAQLEAAVASGASSPLPSDLIARDQRKSRAGFPSPARLFVVSGRDPRRRPVLIVLAVPAAALAQEGQDVVVTGRGLDAARGDAVFDIVTIEPRPARPQRLEPARGRAPRRPRLPAVPPLRRPLRQSDQPGRDPARARRQCLEPGAAAPRRRAADRSVRRLDQLAGLRSAPARPRSG